MTETTVLGLDSGLRVTGYGAVRARGGRLSLIEAGVICPPPTLPIETRLRRLYEGVVDVIRTVRPTWLALERIRIDDRDPQSALTLGHARGVLCLAAANCDIPVVHLAPAALRRRDIARTLGLRAEPEPIDVVDALAVAIAHAESFLPDRTLLRAES